nr:NADH dehydrogenase subunit 2 [Coproporus sp.]
MIKFYKILFFNTLVIGTLITISSNSWMGMWLGLEINLLSIIPLMNSKKNSFSNEASLKYFITQSIASTIILFSIIIMNYKIIYLNFSMIYIFNSALLMKLGMAPFHFWFPEIMEGLSWNNCLIMLTWQKIAPSIIIMYNINNPKFFIFFIMMSMIISGILGINQISLRKILTYSSINHLAWMNSAMFINESIWTYYFIIYSIMTINIILMFKILNIYYLKQLMNSINKNFIIKFMFIFNFFSLGGIPPFLGFLPKWLVINNLINSNLSFLTIFMIILTLITLYFYIRLTFSTLILNMTQINYSMFYQINSIQLIMINFFMLTSLIFVSMIFNFN